MNERQRVKFCFIKTVESFAFFVLSILISSNSSGSTSHLTRNQLITEIKSSQNLWSLQTYESDNPDYVVQQSIKAFKAFREGKQKRAKEILENLFSQNKFEVPQKIERISSNNVSIGTYGNFSLWRDLSYITMARIFYEEGDLDRSEVLFRAVPKPSPFYQMSRVELSWTLIKANKLEILKEVRSELSEGSFEYNLIKSYEFLQTGDYKRSIPILEGLANHQWSVNNRIRDRFLLHGYFLRFIEEKPKKDFQTNVFRAKQLLKRVSRSGLGKSSPEISYLVAETYWHLASLYRIEDPQKFIGLSRDALNQADRWLSPWFEVSIKGTKPRLPEEALFLSAIILWEAEKDIQAITRLKRLPDLFPSGEYLEDAYQILGDYYFEQKKFSTALKYFRKLVKVGKAQKAAYGTYKSGWCFYNLKQKYKALRHFQRLTRYYRGIESKGEELPAGSLKDEARKDMMIVLAELTDFDQALTELKLFSFQGKYWLMAIEELIEFYSKLGRFPQAVSGYQWLLDTYPSDKNSWLWLSRLSRSLLANGQRLQISKMLNKYIEAVMRVSSQDGKVKLLSDIEKTILTIHKEARKTDDPQIFKATDDLYSFWKEKFFDLKRGQFYYFGAQRMERRDLHWEAITWYKKASEDKSFSNYKDAGLSAMNIVIQRADQESLKKEVLISEWEKIFRESQWIYTSELLRDQKLNISRYLFEAAHKLKKSDFILKEMPSLLKEKGFDSRFAFLYFEENKRKYANKSFEQSHLLADRVLKVIPELPKSLKIDLFAKSLREIRQESAFQNGFSKGTSKGKNENSYRKWYEKAISYRANDDIVFRAWHNLLISYTKDENQLFLEKLNKFEEKEKPRSLNLSFEQKGLLTAIYKKESQIFESSKKWTRLYGTLKKIYPLVEGDIRKSISFRLVVLAALLYERDEFRSFVTSFVQSGYPLSIDQMEFISRSYLWLGDHSESLLWLIKILDQTNKPDSSVALLVRDHILGLRNSEKNSESSKYFKSRFQQLKDQALLLTSWHRVLEIRAFSNFKKIKTPQLSRIPASVPQDPVKRLQSRVKKVTSLLTQFESSRQSLYKMTRHWSPRVKEKALCSTGLLTEYTKKQLLELREPKIEHPQFVDFLGQIDAKALELEKDKNVEDEECAKQKATNKYLVDINQNNRPFVCEYIRCQNQKISDDFVVPDELTMETFYSLVANEKTRALADDLSRTQLNKDYQSIQLIFIRLLKGDLWNARQLWQSLSKESNNPYQDSLSLLGAFISRAADDELEMKLRLQRVNPENLKGIEKSLYESLSQSLSQSHQAQNS